MPPIQHSCKRHCNRLPRPTIFLALLLLISFATTSSSCTEQERTSLLQFLAGLSQDGGLATTWKEATDCCKWEGITCSRNGTVTSVSLASKSLQGRISQSLGDLTGLQYLNLSYNLLSGSLPLELVSSRSINTLDVSYNHLNGDLHGLQSSTPGQSLQVLNMSSNLFTGEFTSTTWKGMENLIALNASNNSFTGQIPSHFCKISPSFAVLELCQNKLSGPIPRELGTCSRLRVLKAGHNNLNGSLPDELFNATSLEYLSFHRNDLQGIIDATLIVKLSNLVILDLGENNFIHKIPDSIGQLQRLQEIHLDYNSMSGELPSSLSNCTNLEVIDLGSAPRCSQTFPSRPSEIIGAGSALLRWPKADPVGHRHRRCSSRAEDERREVAGWDECAYSFQRSVALSQHVTLRAGGVRRGDVAGAAGGVRACLR